MKLLSELSEAEEAEKQARSQQAPTPVDQKPRLLPANEIGVHIADVSHYVRPGTALDDEAVKRGCSVYLVDRTIPMLPEALSNGLCSLNPHEDKCSFSAIFVMDDKAHIHSRWFGRTVMNSAHRFTYETAQAVIDGDPQAAVKYSKGVQTAASAETGMKHREVLLKLNRPGQAPPEGEILQRRHRIRAG
jgi:exoribonuclease R